MAAVGLALTIGLTLATRAAAADTEERILSRRADEVAAVLTAAVSGIEAPLTTTAELVEAGQDPELFERVMGTQVGEDRRFDSASLWEVDELAAPVAVVGETPILASRPPAAIQAFVDRALASDPMSVLDLVDEDPPTLGYGFTTRGGTGRYLVYAEQALPPNRTEITNEGEAFTDVDYELMLDTADRTGTLLIASADPFPTGNRRATSTATFGDSELRVVVTPRRSLGGDLLANLWWIVAVAGTAMTVGAATLTARLQQRRAEAESLAATVSGLYGEQRDASLALQQRLLPRQLPQIGGVEIATSYTPGVAGTEVGGDWYEVVDLGRRTMLVVGDASGRGLGAAGVMAAVRHSVRAYATQGDGPTDVLGKINQPGAIDVDGHIVTVLCALLDREAGTLEVATAGHPPPVVRRGDGQADLLDLPVGPPVGAAAGSRYRSTSAAVGPGVSVVLFTDGLFERRGESIDVGLERVRATCAATPGEAGELVAALRSALASDAAPDDSAILAVHWRR